MKKLFIIIIASLLFSCAPFGKSLIEVDPKVDADIAGIKGNINKLMDANLQAVAGFNNRLEKIENTAGRDVITNESDLMLSIFKIISGVLCTINIALLTFMRLIVINNKKQLQAKDLWIDNLIKSNEKKDAKIDLWMQGYVEKLNQIIENLKK